MGHRQVRVLPGVSPPRRFLFLYSPSRYSGSASGVGVGRGGP